MHAANIESDLSLGMLGDERLRQLAAYWEGLRRGRAAPSRADVDPTQITPLLPYVFMADVLRPLDFRFRLAGTHFFDATGSDPTGKRIAEVFPAEYCDAMRLHWREAVEQVRPKVGSGMLWGDGRDHLRWEGLILPLSSSPGVVDILLGGFVTALIAQSLRARFGRETEPELRAARLGHAPGSFGGHYGHMVRAGSGMTGRTTDDPVAPEVLRAELERVWMAFEAGGLAIVPLDVAYAVVGATERAIRALFAAKQRSYDKPSGMFGNWRLSEETHELPEEKRAMIRALIEEEKLPFSVVAPFRRDARMFRNVEPFVLESSSKAGTLDMLLNAGQFHDAVAESSRRRGVPVFGSSANRSLQGSRYRLQDIDAEVRAAAAVEIDHGRSKYANEHGRSSTIVDFRDWSVVRVGVCFERLEDAFRRRFGVALRVP